MPGMLEGQEEVWVLQPGERGRAKASKGHRGQALAAGPPWAGGAAEEGARGGWAACFEGTAHGVCLGWG